MGTVDREGKRARRKRYSLDRGGGGKRNVEYRGMRWTREKGKMRDNFSVHWENGGEIERREEEEESLLRLGRCTGCQRATDGVRDPDVDN